jgi:hypothetical protein
MTYRFGTSDRYPSQSNWVCPFDVGEIAKGLRDGSVTADKFVNFGASASGQSTSTGCDMDVIAMEGVPNADGKQCLPLFAFSSYAQSYAHNHRTANLWRPGLAQLGDIWICFPTNGISPVLVAKIHQGGVDLIVIAYLANVDANPENKAVVIQVVAFKTCFIKYVDAFSHYGLTTACFSAVAMTITMKCSPQHSSGGKHALEGGTGNYVYHFDYSTGSSKPSV